MCHQKNIGSINRFSNKLAKDQDEMWMLQIARMAALSPTSQCPWSKYIAPLPTNPCLRRATNPKVRCKQIHEEDQEERRGANGKIMPPPHSVVIRSASETD